MKLSGVKLSDSFVAKLKAGVRPGAKAGSAPAKYCIWDNACPGFGVEVTLAGGKLLVVKTCRDGVRGWHPLGRWPNLSIEDARTKAYALKDQVKRGEDPKAIVAAKKAEVEKKKLRWTVGQLCDRFIKDHIRAEVATIKGKVKVIKAGTSENGNRASTAKEHVRLIEKHIRPALGKLIAADVGTAEVASVLSKIHDATPIQANRVRSVLGKMFKRAELWGLRPAGSNPVPAQDRAKEHKRERNLSDSEIKALGKALRKAEKPKEGEDAMSPYALAAIRLSLLTGMRRGEVLGLRWDWVNLEEGTIVIPAEMHKTGGKTGKVRVVRLCAAARQLLRTLPRGVNHPYVIIGHVHGQALVNVQDPWELIRKESALVDEDPEKQAHFHDLRRTFASVAARMGYPELWIGALLGHAAGTVTAGYARVNQDPLREAVEAIGGRIAGLLDGSIDLAKEAKGMKQRSRA
jgi:integrase